MSPIQILVILFALFALVSAIVKYRKEKIPIKEAVFWSILWIGIIIVALIPGITNFFANLLNIGRGADVVLYASVIVLFYVVFQLYSKIEETQREITKLVRKIAIKKEKSTDE